MPASSKLSPSQQQEVWEQKLAELKGKARASGLPVESRDKGPSLDEIERKLAFGEITEAEFKKMKASLKKAGH